MNDAVGSAVASARGLLRTRVGAALAAAVVLAVAVALPVGFSQYVRSVLVTALLYALLALGLNVVVGFAGLLDLGYVAFFAIGAYSFAIPTTGRYAKALLAGATSIPPTPVWHDWLWLLIPVGLVAAMVTGVILGAPTLRLRGDYLAIVTLGFGEIVRIAARNLDSVTLGPRGLSPIPHPQLNIGFAGVHYDFGVSPIGYYYVLLVLTVVMVVVIVRLNHSRIGRAWAAIREDEVAAVAMGVPAVRMKLWAFAIGASTAGVAGVVYAQQASYISPDNFQLITSFLIVSVVVLGGMGSIPGSIVGAFVVVLVPEVLRSVLKASQEYRFLLFGAVLILVMIFRPQGLVPSRRRAIELRGAVRESSMLGGQAPMVEEDVDAAS
ncbi:MAG TPA: branched-chain amino acid ABC transporter permease [Actinomycetota bacterium]|jgi:branched-chain amino acid transport system permease protein